jgi:GDP-4-dehydro-6-deoxy-D-mannose reductase
MMKVLLTGGAGFVGHYLNDALRGVPDVAVVSTSRLPGAASSTQGEAYNLDVTDLDDVRRVLAQHRPSHVVNLAAIAAASSAETDPQSAWRVHVAGALNVAQAIREMLPDCCLLHVSSGLVYGVSDGSGKVLEENDVLTPIDDYAVTKAAADVALGALAHKGQKILRMRPFNHTGPGQSEAFAVANFAAQIAKIEAGLLEPVIRVGNLDTERDFLDVRDVVHAYCLALLKSDKLPAGTIFNVASGVPRRIRDVLGAMIDLSGTPITVQFEADRFRAADLPRIVGDASRARAELNWSPTHTFGDTLRDVLNSARARVLDRSTS